MPLARRILLAAAAPAAAVLAGCSIGDDGPQQLQTREVAAFTRIDNRDSVDVRVRVGGPQRVRVLAGEKVIGGVRTEVQDGTLRVRFDDDRFGGDDVIVEATVPRITGIVASGSGDIDVADLEERSVEVESDGSADITLTGTAARLALGVEGSGDADLAGLAVHDATVVATGSGDVDVRAEDSLDVTVDGSGDVRYHGSPRLTRNVDGSGELSQMR